MIIGDIFKSKKQRLINGLNKAGLYPQAILISQFDGSNWIMNDDRVSLEIDLLLAQNVSRDAALISFSRFTRSKELAYSLNLSVEALFLNEYCIIYRLYIELLDSLENDSESRSEKAKIKDKSKLISRVTIKELLSPDLPIKKSESLIDGVEEGNYFVSELNDKYQLFIFFSNPRNAIQEFKKIIDRYIEKAVNDKISSQNIQLWQNNIKAVNSLDDSKFEKWIIETKEHVFFALSNQIVVQLSKGVKLYRIDFLGLTSIDLDAIITPVFGPIIFNKPYSNPSRDIYSNEKLHYSIDQINRIVLFLFSLFSDGEYLLSHESKYLNVSMNDFDSFSNSEEFQYLFDNLLKIEIGKDWLDAKIIEQVFIYFHSKYTNYERILILSELYSSVRNGNVIKVKSEKFDKLKNAYSLSYPGAALRNHNSNRVRDLFGVNLTLLIMQTNIEKEKTKFDEYAASLGLTNQEFFEHLLVTNDEELEKYRDKLTLGLPLNFIDLPTNLKVNTDNKNILDTNENEKLNLLLRDHKIKDAYDFLLTKLDIIKRKNFDFNQYNFQIILNFAGLSINIQEDLENLELILNSIALDAKFKDIDVSIQSQIFGVLGLNQSYQNKEEDAIRNFTYALDLNPLDASTHGSRGCSLMNLNRNIEALEDFNKAISLGEKTFINYFNRGKCKQSLTKFSEALEDFNAAYELNPKDDNVIMQRDLLQAIKDNGLMDQIEQLAESEENNINIDEEKISFIYELLMRVSMADHKLDNKEAILIAAGIRNLKALYKFEGNVKRAESLSFFSKTDEFSDDEKTSIIGLLIALISIDEVVTYSELSLVISYCLGLSLSMDGAEDIIDSICKNESLDKNIFYLYITEIYTSMKNEMPDHNEEFNGLVDQILNLEQEKVANAFTSLPLELKTEVFFATILYDEKRGLARNEADKLNDQAWDKMKNGYYYDALIDAKKSIDVLSMSINNDTIALIYYNLKNYNEAYKFANISIELDQSISDHYVTRAKIYIKLKKSDLAKIDLEKAIELDEENEEAKSLSESLKSSPQDETVFSEWSDSDLEEYLKQTKKVNTKLLYSLRDEYLEYEDNENFPEAVIKVTQIIEQIPVLKGQSLIIYADPIDMLNGIMLEEMYFNRSQIHYKMNLYNEAKNDLIKAISTNPRRNEAQFHHSLGCTLIQCGDFTSCIEQFNIALSIDPGYFDSYYMRAVAYTSDNCDLRDINLARKDLNVYLDNFPDDAAANKLLVIINSLESD